MLERTAAMVLIEMIGQKTSAETWRDCGQMKESEANYECYYDLRMEALDLLADDGIFEITETQWKNAEAAWAAYAKLQSSCATDGKKVRKALAVIAASDEAQAQKGFPNSKFGKVVEAFMYFKTPQERWERAMKERAKDPEGFDARADERLKRGL